MRRWQFWLGVVISILLMGWALRSFKLADAWEAVQHAKRPRIHTFLSTSPLHMKFKLQMEPEAVHQAADTRLRIPMREGMRSLNIAVAVAMAAGEALRQMRGFGR